MEIQERQAGIFIRVEAGMKLLFISDLHIGDGSKSDDFADGKLDRNDWRLIEWIRDIKADKVYLVGDVWELWQFKSQAIRNAHFLLWKFLHGKKFAHIRGNHDYGLMSPLTKTLKTKSGKRVLISHGFQNDRLMTNPFARFGIWLLGQTLEKIWPDIDNGVGYKCKQKKSRTVRNTLEYANKMLKKYDIVILGHSHRQMIEKSPLGKIYTNCGTCQGGKTQGILLDTLTDNIKIV
jgi:UDP-2,3-diacylglucosamine pyrophosphatase LpxH